MPDEGLTMACQYCGAEAAVPDLEQRSKKEERRGGGGEGAGRLPHRPVVVSRFPMAPVMIAFLMAMAGIGLSRAGFFESMMGDAGESQLKLAEERIRASGFSPTGGSSFTGLTSREVGSRPQSHMFLI